MDDLLRRSLHTIRKLKEGKPVTREPIAIIGMSCRFPGACSTPEKFWEFLCNKGDGVRDVPPERWDIDEFHDPKPGQPGKMYLRQANFLQEDVGQFDARFFRISPLEAAEMDPQQRILLELSWEALERAGQNVEGLRGSKTGVFIGIIGSDYSRLPRDPNKVNPYRGTGSIPSIASGRIAHVLGFHGPALSVDTTCSSSLVSLQLACDSLHKNKSRMALAGGVNLMLSPNPMISLCMMNALAADGRCRPFDGDGQGYGRAEGAGLVVLKKLSVAIEDNDPILAVVRSTAVNQDGPSSGLTVPNGNAQRELIREALADAGLKGEDINYLESHGTGTALGDPIEIRAVRHALGEHRTDDNALTIGSVKGNVGHLEGAAGICSLIKVVLCLQNKQIPANINLDSLNPRVPLGQVPAQIPDDLIDWTPAAGRARLAGVSSFGFSGTNAHAILAEPPSRAASVPSANLPESLSILKITAKTQWALLQLRQSYVDYLKAKPDIAIEDLCYTANVCRSDFPLRSVYVARSVNELRQQIESSIEKARTIVDEGEGEGDDAIDTAGSCKVAFLFNGKAKSLGRDIYNQSVQYRRYLDQCDELFTPHVGGSLKEMIFAVDRAEQPPLARRAAMFATEYAMAMYLRSLNIVPSAVWAGSQEGNYAAACAADILLLDDAVELIVDPASARLESLQPPQCRFLAPDTAQPLKKSELMSAAFWRELRTSTADEQSIAASLLQQDYRLLLVLGDEKASVADSSGRMRGVHDNWVDFIESLGTLYCAGVDIDWSNLHQNHAQSRKILLPTYPFERRRYWSPLKPTASAPGEQLGGQTENKSKLHPLLGRAVSSPEQGKNREFAYRLNLARLPEAKDTHGILHVGYYQEILKRVVQDHFGSRAYRIEQKRFASALILSDDDLDIRLVFEQPRDQSIAFRFYSQADISGPWDMHVEGSLILVNDESTDRYPIETIDAVKKRSVEHYQGTEFYTRLQQRDINLGPAVQWVEELWSAPGETLVRFKRAGSEVRDANYVLGFHPGVMDACAQVFHAALFDDTAPDMKFMVVKWQDFTYHRPPEDDDLWCHVLLEREAAKGSIVGSFDLFDGSGNLLVSTSQNEMKGLKGFNVRELKKIREEAKSQSSRIGADVLKRIETSSSSERTSLLADYLRDTTADVLGIPVNDIRQGDTLTDMGIDSMSGVMLQAAIARDLDIEAPLDVIIQGPTLQQLSKEIVSQLPQAASSDVSSDLTASVTDHATARAVNGHNDLWFARSRPGSRARTRLFCLPYGGGGASIYAQWNKLLGEDIDVCAIQLPHRENRLNEQAIVDIDAMVDQLAQCIEPRLDLPYAFYGHSMGALIAYRLAYRLWQHSDTKPAHLFVGGYTSPLIHPNPLLARARERLQSIGLSHIPGIEEVRAMPENQLRAFANTFTGFQRIPASEHELRELLLPIFVGDLQLVSSYEPKTEELFDVAITALHGKGDTEVLRNEMQSWEKLTRGPFEFHELSGDHLFLQKDQSQAQLLELIAQQCSLVSAGRV